MDAVTETSSTASAPFVEEGDGPVALVLIAEDAVESDGLGVVAHYLAEEAGFHTVRIGARPDADSTPDERVADAAAVMDAIGLRRAWVGGHAGGGTLARRFAEQHVDRMNGLLLMGVEDEPIELPPAIPVLVIHGGDDESRPHGERLQASAPERASIKVVDGAGERFPTTHPIHTAVAVEEYLDWD